MMSGQVYLIVFFFKRKPLPNVKHKVSSNGFEPNFSS